MSYNRLNTYSYVRLILIYTIILRSLFGFDFKYVFGWGSLAVFGECGVRFKWFWKTQRNFLDGSGFQMDSFCSQLWHNTIVYSCAIDSCIVGSRYLEFCLMFCVVLFTPVYLPREKISAVWFVFWNLGKLCVG